MGPALIDQGTIDVFCLDDLGLFGLFVEDRVFQGFAFVEDRDVIVSIEGESDGGITHGVGGTFGLDLIGDVFELEGEVFGKDTRFPPGENACQVVVAGEGAMSVVSAPRLNGKALVEVGDELGQVSIARLPIRDAA